MERPLISLHPHAKPWQLCIASALQQTTVVAYGRLPPNRTRDQLHPDLRRGHAGVATARLWGAAKQSREHRERLCFIELFNE
jgi:hypothetical protein